MQKTSDLLLGIREKLENGPIDFGLLAESLGTRSHMLMILILSLPNSLPVPGIPGLSTLTGLPILFIALQIIWGRESVWLPRSLARKKLPTHFMRKLLDKTIPLLVKTEKFIHPRFELLCTPFVQKLVAVFIAIMAFILALPIVGANFPPGLSITLMAFALLSRDGLFVMASIVFCLLCYFIMYKVLYTVITAGLAFLHKG